MSDNLALDSRIRSVGIRQGRKPETNGPVPHRQITDWPQSALLSTELHDFAARLPGLASGKSHIGDGGLSAFFLPEATVQGWSEYFLIDNEFAHIHADASHSLHLVLPHELGLFLQDRGWTEQHPLGVAGAIPSTNFMLFGARTPEELEISKLLIERSWSFSRGHLLQSGQTGYVNRRELSCAACE